MASQQRHSPLLVLAGLVAVSLLCVSKARADEPTLAEATYDPSAYPPAGTQARLLLTGAGLAVGWYGASLGSSYLWKDAPNAKDLRLPVVGSWLSLRNVGCGDRERSCETAVVVFRTAVAIMSGVGQLGGLAVLWEGLWIDTGPAVSPSAKAASARVRPSLSTAEQRAVHKLSSAGWAAAPLALPDGSLGLGISGRF